MPASTPPAAQLAPPAEPLRPDPISRYLADQGLLPPPGPSAAAPPSPAEPPGPAVPPAGLVDRIRDQATDIVLASMEFIGVPYRRGGTSVEEGFDCSGFTRHVFEHSIGLVLPRRADDQARAAGLRRVPREALQPGDLVFFNTLRRTFSHVGIYVGDGKFIHAPRSGARVRVEDMRVAYWSRRFTGARRAPSLEPAPEALGGEAPAQRPALRTAAHP